MATFLQALVCQNQTRSRPTPLQQLQPVAPLRTGRSRSPRNRCRDRAPAPPSPQARRGRAGQERQGLVVPSAPDTSEARGGQRGEIGPGVRFHLHPRAGQPVEHPERNFLPAARVCSVRGASRATRSRLLYDVTDPDQAATPKIPRIKHPTSAAFPAWRGCERICAVPQSLPFGPRRTVRPPWAAMTGRMRD